jgi:hypothetical protein
MYIEGIVLIVLILCQINCLTRVDVGMLPPILRQGKVVIILLLHIVLEELTDGSLSL